MKVKDLVFPMNVVVLKEDVDFSLILGRSFLHTSRALIDVEKEKLLSRLGKMKKVFKFLLIPIPSSNSQDTFFSINHTTHDMSLSLQETKSSRKERPKALKSKGKYSLPKLKKGLIERVPIRFLEKGMISDSHDPVGALGT